MLLLLSWAMLYGTLNCPGPEPGPPRNPRRLPGQRPQARHEQPGGRESHQEP